LGERTSGAVPLDENRVVPEEVVLSSGEESTTVKTGTAYAIDADPMAADVVPASS
jgi:hypothetical protein